MTTTMIREVAVDVSADLSRAREVVAEARTDGHTALIAHTALLTIETLTRQVEQEEQALRTERDQWTDWVQFAVDRSAEVADDQSWCEVYDDAMESLGLPPRRKPVEDVNWRITVTFRTEVDSDTIRDAVVDDLPGSATEIEVDSPAYVTFECEVTGTVYEHPEGECCCDSIGSYEVDEGIPSEFSEFEVYNRGDVYCDNCG